MHKCKMWPGLLITIGINYQNIILNVSVGIISPLYFRKCFIKTGLKLMKDYRKLTSYTLASSILKESSCKGARQAGTIYNIYEEPYSLIDNLLYYTTEQ